MSSRRLDSSIVLALAGVLAGLLIGNCGGKSSSPVAGSSPSPTPAPTPTPTPTPPPTTTPAPGVVTITIVGQSGSMSFSPSPANVQVGQQVRWRNGDSIGHTATQNGGGFDTGLNAPGATSAPITFSAPATINYHCNVHPTMLGTLNVTS